VGKSIHFCIVDTPVAALVVFAERPSIMEQIEAAFRSKSKKIDWSAAFLLKFDDAGAPTSTARTEDELITLISSSEQKDMIFVTADKSTTLMPGKELTNYRFDELTSRFFVI
jgi:DNA replication protein DnaC